MSKPKNKTSLEAVNEFLANKQIAVAGASANKKKFGNIIFRKLLDNGFQAAPVNPKLKELEGHPCFPNLLSLPKEIKAVVIITPPEATLHLLEESLKTDIRYIWIQQGAEDKEVMAFCEQHKLNVITGHCLLMFLEPVKGIHKIHRFFNRLFGVHPT